MLTEEDLEGIAVAAVERAGLDPHEPQNPIELAEGLGLVVLMDRWPGMRGPAVLARVSGEHRVYLRPGLPTVTKRWAVAHETAHHLLGGGDEDMADRLAAALLAPLPAALRACRAKGPSYFDLARALGTTASAAALRWSETTGVPLALVTPVRVRVRGAPFAWPAPAAIRGLVKAVPRGLLREPLEPKRSVVRASP